MKQSRKALSLALALILIIGTLVIPSFADGASLNVEGTSSSIHSGTFTWSIPSDLTGHTLKHYVYQIDGGAPVTTSDTSVTVSGLQPSTSHTITVKAVETISTTVKTPKTFTAYLWIDMDWHVNKGNGWEEVSGSKVHNKRWSHGMLIGDYTTEISTVVSEDVVFATGTASFTTQAVYDIALTVENGGFAYIGGNAYTAGTHTLSGKEMGESFTVKAYSHAGYTGAGFTSDAASETGKTLTYTVSGNGSITAHFSPVDNVYGSFYYVTDGTFTGYKVVDGTPQDISSHNAMDDALAATLDAVVAAPVYQLGDTATVNVAVAVQDGDGATKTLNETDFYATGKEAVYTAAIAESASFTVNYDVPATEQGLIDNGYVLSADASKQTVSKRTYVKNLSFSLVDIYHGGEAKAVLATDTDQFEVEVPIYYTLTKTAVNGTIEATPSDSALLGGTTVTLTATPATGYVFSGWTGATPDAVDTNKATVVMDADKTVVATFVLRKTEEPGTPANPPAAVTTVTPVENVRLTVNIVGSGKVLPGTGDFGNGYEVMLTVIPDEGYKLLRWEGANANDVTVDNKITMNGPKTITAVFGLELEDDATPQGSSAIEETVSQTLPEPEAAVKEETEVTAPATVLDEPVAQAAPELPKTGGIPILVISGFGVLLAAGGMGMKRRNQK